MNKQSVAKMIADKRAKIYELDTLSKSLKLKGGLRRNMLKARGRLYADIKALENMLIRRPA